MRYEDFVVHIGGRREDSYAVRVLQSPAGEGRGQFRPPVTRADMTALSDRLREGGLESRDASDLMPPIPGTAERDLVRRQPKRAGVSAKGVGQLLFDSIFEGQVARLYDRSLGQLEGQGDVGLRIKLRFDADALADAELEGLPWELMYREETGRFLGLDRHCSIVRYLDVAQAPRPIPLPERLRVLVVMAEPEGSGLGKLDLQTEGERIVELSEEHEGWEVKVEEKASVSSLRHRLATDGPFHVVHFMGHGGFDPLSGEGLLFFQQGSGEAQPITGQALATKLIDFPDLGLVFLNACETANSSAGAGRDPFAGVANALVRGGVPAVIAMQRPIADVAAIAFSDAFYTRLAGGACADEALVEGRQAIHSIKPDSVEWMIPVLFARIRDGALFDPPAPIVVDPLIATQQVEIAALEAEQSRLRRGAVAAFLSLAVLFLALWGGGFFTPRSTVLKVDHVFATSADDVEGELKTVELMADGTMRLFFEFRNDGESEKKLAFDFGSTYLADEQGHPYDVLRSDMLADAPVVQQALAPGETRALWVDVPAPLDGAQRFGVALAQGKDSNVSVPFFEVELPEYAARLGRRSEAREKPAGVETFESGLPLAASAAGLEAAVAGIDLERGQSMRWNLSMINRTAEKLGVDFDLERVMLVDNLGNVYRAQGFGFYRGQEFFDGVEMRRGLRSEPWFEFVAPQPGASSFSFRLATKEGSGVRFDAAEVAIDGLAGAEKELAAGENLLSAPVKIRTSQSDVEAEVLAIEKTPEGQMRWRLRLWNRTGEDVSWGIDYPKTYLSDDKGRRYDLVAAEPKANVRKEGFRASLVAGSRALPWLDLPAPFKDAGALTLRLASASSELVFQPVRIAQLSWPGARTDPGPKAPRDAHRLVLDRRLKAPAGLAATLESVDLFTGDRMRFNFRWLNAGDAQPTIGLRADGLKVGDEKARAYRVAQVDGAKRLLPGLAGTCYFETEAPRNGARIFDLKLAGQGLASQEIRLELPDYPEAFSKQEKRAIRSFELGQGEHEIRSTLKGLRAKLIGIDHLGNGRLRWHLELFNEGGGTIGVGYDPGTTKLLMGGKTYRLSQTDSGRSLNVVRRTLGPGGAWRPWLEFAGSFAGDEDFDLILASPDSGRFRYRVTGASLADVAKTNTVHLRP